MSDATPQPTQHDKANFLFRFAYQAAVLGWLTALTCGGMAFKGCTTPTPPPEPPPAISLPLTVQGDVGRAIPIDATTAGSDVQWWCEDTGDLIVRHSGGSKSAVFVSPKPGTYTVLAWTALKGKPTDAAVCKVTVGTPTPPVPPVPPLPPTPIPGDGFRVLIVYDASDMAKYKPGQLAAMFGQQTRSYLQQKCAKGPDGKTPEFRVLDKDANVAAESKVWQDAIKLPRASLPWLVVANGDKGTSVALPDNADDTLKLLKQFGGE